MSEKCPTHERWQEHLDGTLPADQQALLTEHLGHCGDCQKTLETLAGGSDSLLALAKKAGEKTVASSPALEQVLGQWQGPPTAETQAESPADKDDSFLSFLSPSEKPGHLGRLGHYEVYQVIGKGGFGVVLKGFDERLHRVVAIKVLSPAFAANGSARKRFIREARAAAAVKNEHVVAIYDVQADEQPPYLVMECIDGISLQDKIDKHGALGVTEILRIGMQIAEGLAAAHKQGKIHRDIKPANILLENGVERVKITDFGLARAVDDASVTQSGTVAGTPMYMSPEQAEGIPIDHRSDLFSLGSVLYTMCTGHSPFRASGTHAVLKRVIDAAPRPIREINNEIPDWLCDIIAKLQAKKPEDRFQSAKEVADLLGQHLAHVQQPNAMTAPAPVARPVAAPRSWQIGERVLAQWTEEHAEWHSVWTILEVKADSLRLRAGDLEDWVKTTDVRPSDIGPNSRVVVLSWWNYLTGLFTFGTNVGTVTEQIGDRIHVRFDTGKGKWTTLNRILVPAPEPVQQLNPVGAPPRRGEPSSTAQDVAFPMRMTFIGLGLTILGVAGLIALLSIRMESSHGSSTFRMGIPDAWFTWESTPTGSGPHVQVLCWSILFGVVGAGCLFWGVRYLRAARPRLALGICIAVLVSVMAGAALFFLLPDPQRPQPGKMKGNLILTRDRPDLRLTVEREGGGNHGFNFDGLETSVELPPGRYLVHGRTQNDVLVFQRSVVLETNKVQTIHVTSDWVQLFNGKDLSGWKTHPDQPGEWAVANGILIGGGPKDSYLYTERDDFADFHFRAECQINEGGNSGIYFRAPFGPGNPKSYEAQINVSHRDPIKTGSLHPDGLKLWEFEDVLVVKEAPHRVNEWFTLEVIARGPRIIILVNGKTTVDWIDPQYRAKRGHLALQRYGLGTVVQFRKVEIKELLTEAPALPLAVAPFDVKKAKEHQDAWAKHLGAPVEFTNSIGMQMRLIPPGEFRMGTNAEEVKKLREDMKKIPDLQKESVDLVDWETPQHEVRLTKPFRISAYEVTVAQFRQFVEEAKYKTDAERDGKGGQVRDPKTGLSVYDSKTDWRKPGSHENDDRFPVVQVSWNDAQEFCRWLSKKENIQYRLPTEAEWEYACRAGNQGRYSFGDDPFEVAQRIVMYQTKPAVVGSKKPNGFGLFDMEGNAWEWIGDRLATRYDGFAQVDPQGPKDGDMRVLRGGGFETQPLWCRAAIRHGDLPKTRTHDTGFRVVAVIDSASKTPPERGWVQLFNGKDLSRWVAHVPKSKKPIDPHKIWDVNGNLIMGKSGYGETYLRTEKPYKDFILKLEYRCPPPVGGRAGISLLGGGPDKIWPKSLQVDLTGTNAFTGYEVLDIKYGGFEVPAGGKGGEWWPLEIVARNGIFEFFSKGVLLGKVEKKGPHEGFIGFFTSNREIHFRNVEIKELLPTPAVEPGWVQLFNGKNLDGWKASGPFGWGVQREFLVGKDEVLTHEREFQDFHCRFEAKIPAKSWVSLRFRTEARGREALVYLTQNRPAAAQKSPPGALFVREKGGAIPKLLVAPDKDLVSPDTWFKVDVIVRGKLVEVKINGTTTAKTQIDNMPARGTIALSADSRGSIFHFRKIEIKELPPTPPVDPGWVRLFNGKDLDGWKADKTKWTVKDGVLIVTGKGSIETTQSFAKPLLMRAEMMLKRGKGTVRFNGDAAGNRFTMGVEEEDGKLALLLKSTLPLLDEIKPVRGRFPVGVDEWISIELRVDRETIKLAIPTLPGMGGHHFNTKAKAATRGPIELNTTSDDAEIHFRKIEIKELPPTPPVEPGWVQIFNGKDLDSWANEKGGPGNWKVVDGAITCSGPVDHLYTARGDYGNFHLRAKVKFNDYGNSGIYFRAGKPLAFIGDYEAQITNNPEQGQVTGSLYNLVRLRVNPVGPDTWFIYEIIAEGNRIQLFVDGKKTADYTETRPGRRSKGFLALQHHDPKTKVQFEKIEIKELPADSIDLVPLARPEWDRDRWKREDNTLVCPVYPQFVNFLPFDVKLPKEYEVEAIIERLSGNEFIAFNMSAQGKWFKTVLDAKPYEGGMGGLGPIDGKGPHEGPAAIKGMKLKNGVKHTLRWSVRAGGIHLTLDGKTLIDYQGGYAKLDGPRAKNGWPFFVEIHNKASYRIHSLRLTTVSIKQLPPPAVLEMTPTFTCTLTKVKHGPLQDARTIEATITPRAKDRNFLVPGRVFGFADGGPFLDIGDTYASLSALGLKEYVNSRVRIIPNQRIHVAWVREGKEMRLYVDGKFQGKEQLVGPKFTSPDAEFLLGNRNGSSFSGSISEVHISSSARYRDDFIPQTRFETDNNTIALYHCDEGQGDKLTDSSGHGHHVTFVGGKWVKADGTPMAAVEPGWVQLFNGKDLAHWQNVSPKHWSVSDRILTGRLTAENKNRVTLWTKRQDYGDFHLRVEAKLKEGSSSLVLFRVLRKELPWKGYSVNINGTVGDAFTGALWDTANKQQLAAAPKTGVKPDEWFTLEIIAQGPRFQVKINGTQVIDRTDAKAAGNLARGQIGFSLKPNTVAQFRKIEIKELPAK